MIDEKSGYIKWKTAVGFVVSVIATVLTVVITFLQIHITQPHPGAAGLDDVRRNEQLIIRLETKMENRFSNIEDKLDKLQIAIAAKGGFDN